MSVQTNELTTEVSYNDIVAVKNMGEAAVLSLKEGSVYVGLDSEDTKAFIAAIKPLL